MDAGKKRASERQLTKDTAEEEGEHNGGEPGGGTFQRADDSVLATRRIVKARRPPVGAGRRIWREAPSGAGAGPSFAPPPASRPAGGLFAGFSLVKSAQPAPGQAQPRSPAPAAVGESGPVTGDSDAAGLVAGREDEERRRREEEEAGLDPRGTPVPPPPDPEEEEGPPRAAEADVTEAPESDDDDVTSVPRRPAGAEGEEAAGEDKASKKRALARRRKRLKRRFQRRREGGGEEKGKAESESVAEQVKEKEPEKEKPKQAEGFAGLSSATNAFSSPFGAPFSASAASSPFSFGVSASTFGTNNSTPSVSPLVGATAGPASAFPSLSSVFGQTNGARVQLFGGALGGGSARGPCLGASAVGGSPPPAVALPAVDVVTGREERALFASEAVLFEFVEGGKWKERGKGEVRLNVAPDGEARPARLVMRAGQPPPAPQRQPLPRDEGRAHGGRARVLLCLRQLCRGPGRRPCCRRQAHVHSRPQVPGPCPCQRAHGSH